MSIRVSGCERLVNGFRRHAPSSIGSLGVVADPRPLGGGPHARLRTRSGVSARSADAVAVLPRALRREDRDARPGIGGSDPSWRAGVGGDDGSRELQRPRNPFCRAVPGESSAFFGERRRRSVSVALAGRLPMPDEGCGGSGRDPRRRSGRDLTGVPGRRCVGPRRICSLPGQIPSSGCFGDW